MVKLVDAGDSKSPDLYGHVGSIPTSGTKIKTVLITKNLDHIITGDIFFHKIDEYFMRWPEIEVTFVN